MITDQINEKLVVAQKEKLHGADNELVLLTLKRAKAELLNAETAGKQRVAISDLEAEKVIRGMMKKNLATAAEYDSYGEVDRAARERGEALILGEFITAQLDEGATRVLVEQIVSGLDNPNIGAVMGQLKARGDVDKGIASRIARELLS